MAPGSTKNSEYDSCSTRSTTVAPAMTLGPKPA